VGDDAWAMNAVEVSWRMRVVVVSSLPLSSPLLLSLWAAADGEGAIDGEGRCVRSGVEVGVEVGKAREIKTVSVPDEPRFEGPMVNRRTVLKENTLVLDANDGRFVANEAPAVTPAGLVLGGDEGVNAMGEVEGEGEVDFRGRAPPMMVVVGVVLATGLLGGTELDWSLNASELDGEARGETVDAAAAGSVGELAESDDPSLKWPRKPDTLDGEAAGESVDAAATPVGDVEAAAAAVGVVALESAAELDDWALNLPLKLAELDGAEPEVLVDAAAAASLDEVVGEDAEPDPAGVVALDTDVCWNADVEEVEGDAILALLEVA
jgi:hypothetical protein